MAVTESKRRWAHVDGRLTLCKKHVRPIHKNIGKRNWYEIVDSDVKQYREMIGIDIPCDFCDMELAEQPALVQSV